MSDIVEKKEVEDAELYIKGFNAGYLMQKHSPKVMEEMLKNRSHPQLPYQQGLTAGSLQYKQELYLEELKEKIEKSKAKGKER